MSINVTVSGNPVCIKRGTMVTAYDPTKQEFEKRRLMRLEQVRQQSKDIAENIRNKLKKEKTKCLSQIEKEGEQKLKNWQARKLLELQNQYREALDEIGIAHKEAADLEKEEDIFVERQESNDNVAKERGRAAAERLQINKNEQSLKKAVPIQRKKITRELENTRSSVISSLQKTKTKTPDNKKKKRQKYDSDSENKVPNLFDLEIDSFSRSCSDLEVPCQYQIQKISKEQQTSDILLQVPTSDKAAQTLDEEEVIPKCQDLSTDTRISERIKRRNRINQHRRNYCDIVEEDLPVKALNQNVKCDCCQCPSRPQPQVAAQRRSKDIAARQQSEDITVQENLTPLVLEEPTKNAVSKEQSKNIIMKEQSRNAITKEQSRNSITKEQSKKTVTKGQSKAIAADAPKETLNREAEEQFLDTNRTFKNRDGEMARTKRKDGTENEAGVGPKIDRAMSKGQAVRKRDHIPVQPKITLKSSKEFVPEVVIPKPVRFYDHPNRFSKDYIPKSSNVEKIDDDNLIISPNLSEGEIREKMRQRDIEAHIRGQVALEKERLQREYKELLKKLPVLQKQERIGEIGEDKEKYHMSRNRLEELEKKRQNRLDNAYEELFVRQEPKVVTLPKKTLREETPSLNLATWDVDFDPDDTESINKTRSEQLNSLLFNIKAQKDSLLKEMESTLSKDTLLQLTKGTYNDTKPKSSEHMKTRKTKRKRNREERAQSSSDTNVENDSDTKTRSSKRSKDFSTTTTTASPSPRKKPKLKSKKHVLVLQNTSTQTTPKTGQQSAATSPISNTPVTEKLGTCDCNKGLVDDLCEILIKIKEDEKPEVIVNPPVMEKNVRIITDDVGKEESNKDESTKSRKSSLKKPQKSTSWRESLSQTASSQSTSSTSYLELPAKPSTNVLKKVAESFQNDFSRSVNSTGSSVGSTKRIDPKLLTYIKKLLDMSRASIDELGVSAASDVSTPSQSVVETPANNPLHQLMNVMKYFNLDVADLQRELSYTSEESSVRFNTSESVVISSPSTTSNGDRSIPIKTSTKPIEEKPEERSNRTVKQYADIAASCTKKISNLTAMIEKVRAEKKKILSSPPTSSDGEKDVSTKYMDLPGPSKNKDTQPSSSSQDEIDQELLKIDYSYAERLKRLSNEELEIEKKRSAEKTDVALLTSLQKLIQDDGAKSKTYSITEKTTVRFTTPEDKQDSPPLFLDIPKLPRLEAPSFEKKKKRPPPSKGLRAIGGPVPHELSTIIEADSQISTKLESPTKAPSSSKSSSSSVPDILTEVQPKDLKSGSSTSSDDVSEQDTMETMLISIGMEWAIPTLKKTREALALSSSGSNSSRKESGEVSLREFLSKISSSSSDTPSSTLTDSQSQAMSLMEVDNRRTSTPIQSDADAKKKGQIKFLNDSDISSVRDQSDGNKEKFNNADGSLSKTG